MDYFPFGRSWDWRCQSCLVADFALCHWVASGTFLVCEFRYPPIYHKTESASHSDGRKHQQTGVRLRTDQSWSVFGKVAPCARGIYPLADTQVGVRLLRASGRLQRLWGGATSCCPAGSMLNFTGILV